MADDGEIDYRGLMLAMALGNIGQQVGSGISGVFGTGRVAAPAGNPVASMLPMLQMAQEQKRRGAAIAQIENDPNVPAEVKQRMRVGYGMGADANTIFKQAFPEPSQLPFYAQRGPDGAVVPTPGAMDVKQQFERAGRQSPEEAAAIAQATAGGRLGIELSPSVTDAKTAQEAAIAAARGGAALPYDLQKIEAQTGADRGTAQFRAGLDMQKLQQEQNNAIQRMDAEAKIKGLSELTQYGGKEAAEIFKSSFAANESLVSINNVARYAQAMTAAGYEPGKFVGRKAEAAKALNALGINPENFGLSKDTSDYETLVSEARKIALQVVATSKLQPITEQELAYLEKIPPQPTDSLPTLAKKLKLAEDLVARQQATASFLDEQIYGNGVRPDIAVSNLRRSMKLRPLVSPDARRFLDGLAPPPAASQDAPSQSENVPVIDLNGNVIQ